MPDVTIAAATAEDIRAVLRRRNEDDVTMRIALDLGERGTAWAARDESETIGLALAADYETERCVGDIFVEPSFRGQGIGARLLDAALAETGDRDRAVLTDGSNAASLALALRRGLAPRELLLRLAGSLPGEDVLLAMASGEYRFDVAPIDLVRHGIGLDALDRETRGTVRSDRHEHFAERAVGNAFFLNGEMVAYAYCWGDGRIGPIAASSSAYVVQLFAFVLATLNRTHGATWCTLIAPASNVRLTRAALRAGLRIEDRWLLATDLQRADFSRYVAYHRLGI